MGERERLAMIPLSLSSTATATSRNLSLRLGSQRRAAGNKRGFRSTSQASGTCRASRAAQGSCTCSCHGPSSSSSSFVAVGAASSYSSSSWNALRFVSKPRGLTTAMATESFKHVVLGGGNASGYCAKQFVETSPEEGESLCIISGEKVVSYERPALSKAYLFPQSPARLPGFHTCVGGGGERQEPAWYKDKKIEFKTGARVTEANLADKVLTLEDADYLNSQIKLCKSKFGNKAVVVGGGYIGMEC